MSETNVDGLRETIANLLMHVSKELTEISNKSLDIERKVMEIQASSQMLASVLKDVKGWSDAKSEK